MKNILILEDNEFRINAFKKQFIGNPPVFVKTAKDAIEQLNKGNWDVLFLDHDLGDEVYVAPEEENTGSGVARWLEKHKDKIPRLVIIHSLNPTGQEYIKAILKEAIIMPFAWIILKDDSFEERLNEGNPYDS